MALSFAKQGNTERAMELWQQSLDIQENIGDIEGKAATLNNIAFVFAQQGKIERAMELWQRSIDMANQIGDAQGKAVTLANMGSAAHQQGQTDRAMALHREAATILVGIGAWPDLAKVLDNMEGHFRLQALWLGLRVTSPAEYFLGLGQTVFMDWTPKSDAAPLLAASLHYLILGRYEDHPKREELSNSSFALLAACAEVRGITPEEFRDWIETERLNDADFFMPGLDKALRERIPEDSWMFDPELFAAGQADR
jgi:hypothetical protein